GAEYKGTVYLNNPTRDDSIIQARNFSRSKVSNAGTTKLNSIGISINGGYQIKEKTELFWTALVNGRKTLFSSVYKFPKNTRLVNSFLYPDGFKPISIQKVLDVSGIAGIKGVLKNKWHYEYSTAYGNNHGRYDAENTNNASQYFTLGKNAPTKFYTGSLVFQQLTNNLNFAKDFSTKTGQIKLLNIAFGAEWRFENYQIKAGEEAAWETYDPLERKQGGSQNGLIFRPDDEVNKNRNVLGTYIDIESELTDNLLIDIASRYEYYNDFGANLAGKIAARYKFSGEFSLRSSLSKGFRAPGLQQRYFSNTLKGTVNTGGLLVPVVSGIFRNKSDVAVAFGIPSLEAEKSVNLGGGFTARIFNHINLTVDAYWIQIRNGVVLSGRFDKATNPEVQRILANYPEIDQVQFFTNAINTRTRGIDIVLNGNWNIQKANLVVMLAANFNRTNLFGEIKTSDKLPADSLNTNTLFNREERAKVENGQPRDKIILSANYKTGKLGFQLRNTRFGKTALVFDSKDISRDEFFSPKILTDFSINYSPKAWITFTVGANNIFDVYPDKLSNPLNNGEGTFIYAQEASPFGYNGGYYFVSMTLNF
ncbi:MAG: TonB-dependent receptor, partial [Bacteroidota bacterium]|nr:TonB-dependent receptor [Bacteroidota bacterium]